MDTKIVDLMNLAYESANVSFSLDQAKQMHDLMEKFAELIVKECFKAAMIESKGHMNPIDLMQRMKEQVGVDE
jgi:hypothetical protein